MIALWATRFSIIIVPKQARQCWRSWRPTQSITHRNFTVTCHAGFALYSLATSVILFRRRHFGHRVSIIILRLITFFWTLPSILCAKVQLMVTLVLLRLGLPWLNTKVNFWVAEDRETKGTATLSPTLPIILVSEYVLQIICHFEQLCSQSKLSEIGSKPTSALSRDKLSRGNTTLHQRRLM